MLNRFRGVLDPRPDWIEVLFLFGTLGLHRLLTNSQTTGKEKNSNFNVENFVVMFIEIQ
jgi:hypothetical protein